MRSFLVKAIPIFTLLIFLSVMASGFFLKKPIGKEPGIPESITAVVAEVINEDWQMANKKALALSDLWRKIVTRVQFSSERDEINAFDVCMARLRGAIMAKDKSASLQELSEAYEHWVELGR